MNLLSPKKIFTKRGGPFQAAFEISKTENYTFVEQGIEISKSIVTFYKSIPVTKFEARIPEVIPLTSKIIEEYHNFQGLINHCINNAEKINSQLRDLLLNIPEIKTTKEELLAMEFMSLRDVFSNFLNSNKLVKQEINFDSRDRRKNITSTFYEYISDRNVYTHGVLKLRRPDEIFVIEYIANRKLKVYAELSVDMLKSNLEVSDQLRRILSEIAVLFNKNKPV